MLSKLNEIVDGLNLWSKRADKYRDKKGWIEIPSADYNELIGNDGDGDGPVRLSIQDYVKLIDTLVGASCRRLLAGAEDISEEIG